MCVLSLVTQNIWKFGYPCSLGIWVVIKSVVIGFSIRLPLGIMLTPSLSWNTLAIFSLTMSMATGGNPSALWSSIGVGIGVLCCLLAHEFGFCGGINACPMWLIWLVIFFWPSGGAKKYSPQVSGVSYHGPGASWEYNSGFAWDGV
jgi:hypothetical protein